ncbi:MAG: nucleotidyltransferase domain-containing protein [Planctomycetaceae bacterium]|nr:nucleotidyltransferase domain-containing protein [Planctomycetaceae bacterium]
MAKRVHCYPNLLFSVGTQVVALRDVIGQNGRTLHPRGAVGVVVKSPTDLTHAYRIRFPDGVEESLNSGDLTSLAKFKEGEIGDSQITAGRSDLFERVIYQCIIGSQAYGLADSESDIDRRGIYLPPAELHWSLYGVPEQLECEPTQEAYWEIQKFIVLALKSNPNVLECLYTPLVEKTTPLADELLAMRSIFLSRLVYQTYNGYVMSQFKKMQSDIRNQGQVKWKHVMHLIRLLISGISVLREGFVPVRVDEHRDQLLAIKRGDVPWEETEKLRLALHTEFDKALEETKLPERPDYEKANEFLVKARRAAIAEDLP